MNDDKKTELQDHFTHFVKAAHEEYLAAEENLTIAVGSGDERKLNLARILVLRRARTAAIELHQFADRVANSATMWTTENTPHPVRQKLKHEYLRKIAGLPTEDMEILHDLADCFKHGVLTHQKPNRQLQLKSDKVVIHASTPYGKGRYGEGKFGGGEQVMVQLPSEETRPVSAILCAVILAWAAVLAE